MMGCDPRGHENSSLERLEFNTATETFMSENQSRELR